MKTSFQNSHDISHHPLLTFNGTIQGEQCKILKDDGASTNILSRSFFERYKDMFTTQPSNVSLCHSTTHSDETECMPVRSAEVKIGKQFKIFCGDTRYDVIVVSIRNRS